MIALRCLTVASLFLLSNARLHAQRPAAEPAPAAVASDSVAWDRVVEHIWRLLATNLHRAAIDTSATAWHMSFPLGTPVPWDRIEARLRAALRAVPATPDDSVVWTLRVEPMKISGDTAEVQIWIDLSERCADGSRTRGHGNRILVIVPHSSGPHRWGPARTHSVLHGDRMC